MNTPSMDEVALYIRASKDVLDLMKTLGGFFPKGEKSADVEKRLAEAERALEAAQVQLAKSLGYHLCQCTFPPQIMLSNGHHAIIGTEIFQCGRCEKTHPSKQAIAIAVKNQEDMEAYRKAPNSNYF